MKSFRKFIFLGLGVLFCFNLFALAIDDAYKDYLYGDYDAALDKARDLKQDDQVLYFLGLLYIKTADFSQARTYFRRMVKSFPNTSLYESGLVKLADTYFLEDNFAKAESFYLEIENKKLCPNFMPLVYLRLVQIYSKEGLWEDKKKYLSKLKSKYPKSSEREFAERIEACGDFFYIQVGAFSDMENARTVESELKGSYSVYIFNDKKQGYTLYKVRVGDFKNRGEAESIYAKLISQGYPARVYP